VLERNVSADYMHFLGYFVVVELFIQLWHSNIVFKCQDCLFIKNGRKLTLYISGTVDFKHKLYVNVK